MSTQKYKVQLQGGRILGPLGLDRIQLFILRDKITGLEQVRRYPKGEWKDINSFPEIADLLLKKLDGTLEEPSEHTQSSEELDSEIESAPTQDDAVPEQELPPSLPIEPPSVQIDVHTRTKMPLSADESSNSDDEGTVIMSSPEERTVIQPKPQKDSLTKALNQNVVVQIESQENAAVPEPSIASEPTQMLELPKVELAERPGMHSQAPASKREGFSELLKNKKRLAFYFTAFLLVAFVVLAPQPKPQKKIIPFKVVMPTIKEKSDPQRSGDLYLKALPLYNQDTVEGYKAAAHILLDAVGDDPNNVKAICLLASSYMHLIDVVDRDENYFNTVTRLIEQERAKGVNLPETVITDVELYLILGNPDAAINRIVEFTRNRPFGAEMFYYIALSFYFKGQIPEASKYLNNIDPKDYFSPRIPYLYGSIYVSSRQIDEAIKSFQQVIEQSPKHVKARIWLAEMYFKKDSFADVITQTSYVVANFENASKEELARAYYLRARSYETQNKMLEAHADLVKAHNLSPDDQDILLEYYTLKARVGEQVGEAASRAQMFDHVAQGERALHEGRLKDAKVEFLTARNIQADDPTPLLRLAEVFKRTGEAAEARAAYEKAVKLGSTSSRVDFYPKYIQALTDAYEFEEAQRQIEIFKGLNPPTYVVDKLFGDFYYRQEKLPQAREYYKRALSATNVDSSVYNAYAKIMYKAGDYRQAAFYFGLARRFDPFNVDATIGIGKALAEIEGVDKGVSYISNELANNPNKAALFNGIAEIYVKKGDYEAALKTTSNALTIAPQFATTHKTRGDAYAAQEKFREALSEYEIYADEAPLDPSGSIERYRIFMRQMKLKDAKEEIEKVIRNYPKYPGAFYMLGDLYQTAQNWQGAMQAADQEIANNPLYVPAYVLAGSVLNTNREYTKALEYLNKAMRIDPNYVPGLIQAGLANQMLKTYAAAKSMYERALAQDPGNPKIHKYLGVLYYDLGDPRKAAQYLKSYIDLYPDAPDRAEVEQKLHSL